MCQEHENVESTREYKYIDLVLKTKSRDNIF